jgi:AraC-like DNA-binding protein
MDLLVPAATDFQDTLADIGEKTGAIRRGDAFQDELEWPQRHSGDPIRGRIQRAELRAGLVLLTVDCDLREGLRMRSRSAASPPLEFSFCLTGAVECVFHGTGRRVSGRGERDVLFFGPDVAATAEYPAAQRLRLVEIHVEPTALGAFADGFPSPFPPALRHIADGTSDNLYLRPGAITPTMLAVLHQILHCPYRGATRRLYLEGKVLEVMALRLAGSPTDGEAPTEPRTLRSDDVERIHEAKDILVRDMANPPSLLSLARQVCLNDHKLKVGFRQVFGATAFGYLHERRMERARSLLEEGAMNAGEVAVAVGFSNQGHFTSAFKNRFGTTPGAFARGCKRSGAAYRGRTS